METSDFDASSLGGQVQPSADFPDSGGSRRYVLVTPARNEGKYLRALLDSVAAQTLPPVRWIIVNDGSTDETDAIVNEYVSRYGFISLLRRDSDGGRSFGSKAAAFQRGVAQLGTVEFDYLGNLDADITLEPDYYERVLLEMERNPRLGVATGVCWDKTDRGFQCVTVSLNHAVGAVHLFRRACFEAVGGYRPVSVGGMDSLAVLSARMHGWETRCIPELPVYHHKPVDSVNGRSAFRIAYRAGETEYHIGSHPLFALVKALRRWRASPPVFGSLIRLAAYFRLWICSRPRDASVELTRYVHREQMARLRSMFGKGARKLR